MEVLSGEMEIMIQNEDSFTKYAEGTSFVVPANSSFKVIVKSVADYCCSYRD